MARGKVKWYNQPKGYGFILPDDKTETNGMDVAVHIKAIEKAGLRTLNDNDIVNYKLLKNHDGWAYYADEIEIVKDL